MPAAFEADPLVSLYVSAVTEEDRGRAREIRARVAGGGIASPEEVTFLLDHSERLQLEADDLSVLYTTTVLHATTVENELFHRNVETSEFLASMHHELRTPLNIIIGYAELVNEIAAENGYDQVREDLGRVASTARHLLSLVREVLDLSKIEAGHLDLVYRPIDVRDLVNDVGEEFRAVVRRRGNRLAIHAEPGTVEADETRLRQCLINLVGNASKFTEDGEITVEATEDAAGWTIEVRDTGIGMTEAQLGNLFRPFRQADADIAGRFGGTGLGLAVTRRLIEAMGGTVIARSRPGEGSTFTLRLPHRNLATG